MLASRPWNQSVPLSSLAERQHTETNKVWDRYNLGHITENQAIEAWYRTCQKLEAEMLKRGYKWQNETA